MFRKLLLTTAILTAMLSNSAISGGIRAYPMNLSNVGVGIPSVIYVENTSDKATFVTSYSDNDNVMVYPPVIEKLGPGEKQAINVAFMAEPNESDKNYVIVKIGDGYNFKIGVIGN
ncbi:hypothetical protein [Alteromonas gracilis]|uniref:hypothetical protein n=1 Tax=Alteromonas gracilis TaxID=1479524 RepID=UPI0037359CD6